MSLVLASLGFWAAYGEGGGLVCPRVTWLTEPRAGGPSEPQNCSRGGDLEGGQDRVGVPSRRGGALTGRVTAALAAASPANVCAGAARGCRAQAPTSVVSSGHGDSSRGWGTLLLSALRPHREHLPGFISKVEFSLVAIVGAGRTQVVAPPGSEQGHREGV